MYRETLWTMRQFSGFATPEETNRRYRYLLEQGQTGLSVAFDLPDPDGLRCRPRNVAEAKSANAARPSRRSKTWRLSSTGFRSTDVTVSMTINSPAAVIWAMYLAVAEKQGADWTKLSGTLQNDILKEYIAQKEYIFPPRPSMRLVTDTIEFATQHRRASIRSRSAAITSAKRDRRRCRNWRSPCAMESNMWIGRSNADSRSTISRRG